MLTILALEVTLMEWNCNTQYKSFVIFHGKLKFDFFSSPEGLEDTSKFPNLVAELLLRNWTESEIRKVIGENFIRVFVETEMVCTVIDVFQ